MPNPRHPGQAIVQQDLWQGQLLRTRPVTVVQDSPDLLALYSHPRTRYMSGSTPGRTQLPLQARVDQMTSAIKPTLTQRIAGDSHVLTLNQPGVSHSVWFFWDAQWNFKHWYVNLQAPFRRTPLGLQTQDHVLDLVVQPDRSWEWKDEDEFEALSKAGFFTPAQALAIRAAGQAMIEIIQQNGPPFRAGWEHWRPDPTWDVPTLPAHWESLS